MEQEKGGTAPHSNDYTAVDSYLFVSEIGDICG